MITTVTNDWLTRVGVILLVWLVLLDSAARGVSDPAIGVKIKRLTRNTEWRLVSSIPIRFDTYHPQGMVKIGDAFFLSSVEVKVATKRYARPQGGYDRDTGEGVGHLFKFDQQGKLIADLKLGEGAIYHPGGIDFDGRYIWVPVAEYRPDSQSIIYRIEPATLEVVELFRWADHLGGIVHNIDDNSLHGVSWGSRRYYCWKMDRRGKIRDVGSVPSRQAIPNRSFYIDYQDCKFIGGHEMLCAGLASYQSRKDGPRFSLGGLEVINLTSHRQVFQVPLELWTASGFVMTQNPFWMESTPTGLRAFFLPEDNNSTLYIFEAVISID